MVRDTTIYTCDRCGEKIDVGYGNAPEKWKAVIIAEASNVYFGHQENKSISVMCPKCADKFCTWWHEFMQEENPYALDTMQ